MTCQFLWWNHFQVASLQIHSTRQLQEARQGTVQLHETHSLFSRSSQKRIACTDVQSSSSSRPPSAKPSVSSAQHSHNIATPGFGVGRFSLAGNSNWTPKPKFPAVLDSPVTPLSMSPPAPLQRLTQITATGLSFPDLQDRRDAASSKEMPAAQPGTSAQGGSSRRHWWSQQETATSSDLSTAHGNESPHSKHCPSQTAMHQSRQPVAAVYGIDNSMDFDDDFETTPLDLSLSPLLPRAIDPATQARVSYWVPLN